MVHATFLVLILIIWITYRVGRIIFFDVAYQMVRVDQAEYSRLQADIARMTEQVDHDQQELAVRYQQEAQKSRERLEHLLVAHDILPGASKTSEPTPAPAVDAQSTTYLHAQAARAAELLIQGLSHDAP